MSQWSELNSRERQSGLPLATARQVRPGMVRYAFVHDDLEIDDPSLDVSGRYFVSPRDYGFSIRGFKGGKTAWARDFANGTMLVVNTDGQSHVLSPKIPARVLFVDLDGAVLQDSGLDSKSAPRTPDLATIRLTITATVDLQGESPEAARAMLMRMVDRAVVSGPMDGDGDATVVDYAFDGSSVVSAENTRSSDTDFSQLLGL
jgi:hypothetical protein